MGSVSRGDRRAGLDQGRVYKDQGRLRIMRVDKGTDEGREGIDMGKDQSIVYMDKG